MGDELTNSEAAQGAPTRWWLAPLIVLAISLFFFSGRLESSDELLMGLTSRSIAESASLRFPETYGQTFTGYGVGTPVAGVPFYWMDQLGRKVGLLGETSERTLLPLLNAVLFAVMAGFAGGIAGRLRNEETTTPRLRTRPVPVWSVVLAFVASPLLPASTAFYSEMLCGAGLLAMAWGLCGEGRRSCTAAVGIGALATVSARFAMVPFVALILFWGWRRSGVVREVVAGLVGLVAGVAVRLIQNQVLRGSPFDQGYDGQEFTTPILTGLHGMLLSPERGLLVFWPVIAVVAFCDFRGLATSFRRMALGLLGFGVVFHACFWTWHGGWTAGPRFLLPFIALAMPLVIELSSRIGDLAPRFRTLLLLALGWSFWAALLYSVFSPMSAWNDVWGFHQLESRWQFEPQLSLWSLWPALAADGVGRAFWTGLVSGWMSWVPVLLFLGGVLALHFLVPHLRTSIRIAVAVIMAWVLVSSPAGKGRRGLVVEQDGTLSQIPLARISVAEGQSTEITGLLDTRPHGTYTLLVKYDCLMEVRVNGEALVSDQAPLPAGEEPRRKLGTVQFDVKESGLKPIELSLKPHPGYGGLVQVWWTWPGEGRVMEPLGGEFVLPEELNAWQSFCTRLARHFWMIAAAFVALVLLIGKPVGPPTRE